MMLILMGVVVVVVVVVIAWTWKGEGLSVFQQILNGSTWDLGKKVSIICLQKFY